MSRRRDDLRWLPIDHRKCRSKGFVAPHDFVETPLERSQVEWAFKAYRNREVIDRGSRIELIDKP